MSRFKVVAPAYAGCNQSQFPVRVIDTQGRTQGPYPTVWERGQAKRDRVNAVKYANDYVEDLNRAAAANPAADLHDLIAATGRTPFRVVPNGGRFDVEYRDDTGVWHWRASFLLEYHADEYLAERVSN